MRLLLNAALASVTLLACAGSHEASDAGTTHDAITPDAGIPLTACSPDQFSHPALRHMGSICDHGVPPSPEGDLPWEIADAFAPAALTDTDAGLVVEGWLLYRPTVRSTDDIPPLIAAQVRYRIRFDGPAPFAALEEAVPVDAQVALDEYRAALEEDDCRMAVPYWPPEEGRLRCASHGRWDAWAHASSRRYDYQLMPALVLLDRETLQLWWLHLHGLPESCVHDPAMIPIEPCRPALAPRGAWVTFSTPSFVTDDGRQVPSYACPLQPTCGVCHCDGSGDCLPRMFYRCDENTAWLDEACPATQLDDVPPPPIAPCRTDDAYLDSPCDNGPAWGWDVCP